MGNDDNVLTEADLEAAQRGVHEFLKAIPRSLPDPHASQAARRARPRRRTTARTTYRTRWSE